MIVGWFYLSGLGYYLWYHHLPSLCVISIFPFLSFWYLSTSHIYMYVSFFYVWQIIYSSVSLSFLSCVFFEINSIPGISIHFSSDTLERDNVYAFLSNIIRCVGFLYRSLLISHSLFLYHSLFTFSAMFY